jgi:uncharacterized phiE125 gp8 family phage protein
MSLDTLANVKSRLGVTSSADDTLLGLLQASADQWVTNHCDRDFAGGTFTEYLPGGSEFLLLRNYPVSSVTTVKVDPAYGFGSETIISSTAYVVHTERGVIQSVAGPFFPCAPRVVQVVYATATSAVPDDVKQAYALLVGHWYRQVKTQVATGFQNVTQQKAGDLFATYAREALTGWPPPADVVRLLEPYRVPRL